MFEKEMADAVEKAGVDLIISLPCDKNKGFTDLIHERFHVVDVTREEDGVGISAGACMAGKRPAISIQSSGLGNMMNAIMSLTACYRMPMVVLASWRGVDGEKIEAQVPFNSKIPCMLKCYGIRCVEVSEGTDIPAAGEAIASAFADDAMLVVLIHPRLWGESKRMSTDHPPRARKVSMHRDIDIPEPTMFRLDAIKEVMATVGEDDIVVSNIGVPSKEVFASRDRPLNFYMLGSYTQATPIGLGLAVSQKRHVYVIDGDGSMLGSSIMPVLATVRPSNLTVVCLDNGAFGSTGNQTTPACAVVDLGLVAEAFGLDAVTVSDGEGIRKEVAAKRDFIHGIIAPGNSASPNLTLGAEEIKKRFMDAL